MTLWATSKTIGIGIVLILISFLIYWRLCDFPGDRTSWTSELTLLVASLGSLSAVVALVSAGASVAKLTESACLTLSGGNQVTFALHGQLDRVGKLSVPTRSS